MKMVVDKIKTKKELEILKYQNMSPNDRIIELEKIRAKFILKKYGYLPKLERVFKIVKRKHK